MVEPGPVPEVGPSTHCHGAVRSQFRMASAQWEKEQQCARQRRRWNKEKGGWQVRDLEHPGARFVEQLLLLPPKSLTVSFRALSFSVISGSAVRDAPCAAGDLVASMAQTPPCMMDSWIQEMLRSHAVFVGDEFMGKLVLPSTLLWTISCVEARHTTIRRLLMIASANTHTHSFIELSAFCRSCRRRTGGRRSALATARKWLALQTAAQARTAWRPPESQPCQLVQEPMVRNRSIDDLVGFEKAYDTLIWLVGLHYLNFARPCKCCARKG